MGETGILFKETQWFRQWWLITALMGLLLYWSYGILKLYILIEPFGNIEPKEWNIFVFLAPALLLLLMAARLETEIREDGFYYRFLPFQFKKHKIRWKDVEHIYVRNWSLKEFWGWGIKYNLKMTAFTTMGYHGLQINLKNGKKFLFGTQRPDEATEALTKVFLSGR